jgi:hypothetical protein
MVVVQFVLSFLLSSAGSELLNHHNFNLSLPKFLKKPIIFGPSPVVFWIARVFLLHPMLACLQKFRILLCERKRNAYGEHK